MPISSLQVSTADGTVQSITGKFETEITVADLCKQITFYIIPSVQNSIILGMDFLNAFNSTLNCSNFSFSISQFNLSLLSAIQDFTSLSSSEQRQLENMISKFTTLSSKDKLGRTSLISHTIEVGDTTPFRQYQYPIPQAWQVDLEKEIDSMLELNIIEPSTSSYCSPLWLTKKKDGSFRVCFDGRKLNNITTNRDAYPIPRIDVILSKLQNARYISSIDLSKAFLQIPLSEESKKYTAFAVSGKGLFQFVTMPFGLVSAPQTMCRLMDLVIGPQLEPYVFYYLDDILVVTPDFSLHMEILDKLFSRLKEANLTINLDKCQFCRPSLKFLGYVVDSKGLRTDPDKVTAIKDFPIPKTTTQVRRILGMCGYYRRFVPSYSTLLSPLTDLLKNRKKGQTITWTSEADDAFRRIKEALTSAPVMTSPNFKEHFYLMTDCSNTASGGVLFQMKDGSEHPIAYTSKKLNKAQKNYSTTERELLAIIHGLDAFRYYLEGRKFTIITDHSSLLWLHSMKNPSQRLSRWICRLSVFDYNIVI
ncbi:unnamed protein product [Diabrotica balteata]|uniref:Reverse transcriptase domain-containing protein n=1 Tax=Diabrotica balteata TaxID=107213 RepID=A0A9N9SSI7_DIABA|nr:unnamed protein product [Diabrotica balteata]